MSEKKRNLPDQCAVARDLMPLCVDGVASDAGLRRVKKHVIDCEECAVFYQEMQTQVELDVPEQVDDHAFAEALKKVRQKKQGRTLLLVLAAALLAVIILLAGLQAWQYFVWDMQPVPPQEYDITFERTDEWVAAIVTAQENMQFATDYEKVNGTLYIWGETSRIGSAWPKGEIKHELILGQWKNGSLYVGGQLVQQICQGYPVGACEIIYWQGTEIPYTSEEGAKRWLRVAPLTMPPMLTPPPQNTLVPFATVTPLPQQN